jgi:hypothetical protein
MKKSLLLIFTVLFQITNAQVVSINPDNGKRGQLLTTTITTAAGVMSMGSAPTNFGDVFIQQGTTIIYPISFSVYPGFPPYTDSLEAIFDIPTAAPGGFYDVHVLTWVNFPFPTQVDHMLDNGFSIGDALIEGDVYFDANQNGTQDVGEYGMSNTLVMANPSGTAAYTDLNGHYKIRKDSGTYTVDCHFTGGFTQTTTPSSYTISIPPDSAGNDFGLYTPPSGNIKQNFSLALGSFRCNRPAHTSWTITSSSNNIQTGTITISHSSNLSFSSSTIIPTTTSGSTLTWSYTLQPFQSISCNMVFNVPGLGSTATIVAIDSIFDGSGNFNSSYIESYTGVVLCAMDPNDKTVSPPGVDSLHYTLKDSPLNYTIRFQNTGTDTAFNVMILDTLDLNLDTATLEILSASHTMSMQLETNGVMRFTFDNILLPDSNVDELNSHGYVQYRIKPLVSVVDYTPVFNTAYIYFDFNPAIVTNTTYNLLVTQIPTGVNNLQDNNLRTFVYPNPLDNSSTLVIPSSSTYQLKIMDTTGRIVTQKNISENIILESNKFSSGIYYYTLSNIESSSVYKGKFVVIE